LGGNDQIVGVLGVERCKGLGVERCRGLGVERFKGVKGEINQLRL
jgi:hypothetical protein